MRTLVVIAHDMRSAHNVGSLLRTAEGLGIDHVYFSGYTPYPVTLVDDRLPHIAQKLNKQIEKTALGSIELQPWSHVEDVATLLEELKRDGYKVAALEQTPDSIPLPEFTTQEQKFALLLGREVEGIDPELLKKCDLTLEIPMYGKKESFNVVQAAAMALFHLRFL